MSGALALATGLRRGELCGLRWEDLDLAGQTLWVREVVTSVGGRLRITTPKTTGSRRTVHLSGEAVELLNRHHERQDYHTKILGPDWMNSGRVFTSLRGTILHPDNLRRDMARIGDAASVRHLPVHALRHTYASLALRAGVPVEVVSKQLGHASVAFTLTRYRTVYLGERSQWALSLTALLADVSGEEE